MAQYSGCVIFLRTWIKLYRDAKTRAYNFNPRKYKQTHTPTFVQGRGVGTDNGGGELVDPLGFLLCYNISKRFRLNLVDILWCALLDEVHIMSCHERWCMGPWRHPKLEIIKKTADIDFFWLFDKRTMWKNIREPKKSADTVTQNWTRFHGLRYDEPIVWKSNGKTREACQERAQMAKIVRDLTVWISKYNKTHKKTNQDNELLGRN